MQKYTDDEEIARVKLNLDRCKNLRSFLSPYWIEKELLQQKERAKAHSLFWLLLDNDKSTRFQGWLEVLSRTLLSTKFSGVINRLRNSQGRIELCSLLSEIEVVSFYAAKGETLEYEPPKGDLKLVFNGSEVFIEIARLFSSQEEERISSLSGLIWSALDNLDENKYMLSFRISPEFSNSDVGPFIEQVRRTITQRFTVFPSEELPFEGNKASVTILCPSNRGRGYVAGNLFGVLLLDTAGRLKKKILDEAYQLPKGKLNIVVYDITNVGTDFDDIEDAFLGQAALRVCVDKQTRSTWTQPVRKGNGVIHGEAGEQISALIAFKDFDYEHRRIYLNPKPKTIVSQEIQNRL
jgi:hypothetical protein